MKCVRPSSGKTGWARPSDLVNRIPKGSGAPMQASVINGGVQLRRSPTTHKNTVVTQVVHYNQGAGTVVTQTPKVFVYSPSARLRVAIQVVFEDDGTQTEPTVGVPATWQIFAVARNPNTGRESILQQVYPSSGTRNLPDAYEADTAAEILRLDLSLTASGFGTNRDGSVKIIATWEPNTEVQIDELKELYSRCSIAAGTVPEIQN